MKDIVVFEKGAGNWFNKNGEVAIRIELKSVPQQKRAQIEEEIYTILSLVEEPSVPVFRDEQQIEHPTAYENLLKKAENITEAYASMIERLIHTEEEYKASDKDSALCCSVMPDINRAIKTLDCMTAALERLHRLSGEEIGKKRYTEEQLAEAVTLAVMNVARMTETADNAEQRLHYE